MSSQQATLSGAIERQTSRSTESQQRASWTPQDHSDGKRCQNCESHVTADFVRVFGDVDGNAHACLECRVFAAIADGAAADPGHEWRHHR